jgi:L-rhamnose mutarotase
MDRAAFRIRIRPGKVDEYVAAHAAVYPELLEAFTRVGISNYSIFLDGTSAFGYFEAEDLAAADAAMAETEANRRWQEAMAPLVDEDISGVGPAYLPEIFRHDG